MIIGIVSRKYKCSFIMRLDDNCKELLQGKKWVMRCGYAGRHNSKHDSKTWWQHAHREVLRINNIKIPDKYIVDHINMNRLDNRLINLRAVSFSENMKNVSSITKIKRFHQAKMASILAALKPRTSKQLKSASLTAKKINEKGLNSHIGENNYISKKVINTNTGEIFSCIRECAEKNKINYNTLRSKLNGGLKNNTSFLILKSQQKD